MASVDRWFILASGPSQNFEDMKATRRKGPTIAVNNTIFSAIWADYLYAADRKWWQHYGPRVRDIKAIKYSAVKQSLNYGAEKIVTLGPPRATGLGRNGVIHRGGNSGYQAINLAYALGARSIVLLGFDCGYTYGRRHYHQDHPTEGVGLGNAEGVELWRENFVALAADLRDEGVHVVNCSRETTLDCFERMKLEDVL